MGDHVDGTWFLFLHLGAAAVAIVAALLATRITDQPTPV